MMIVKVIKKQKAVFEIEKLDSVTIYGKHWILH